MPVDVVVGAGMGGLACALARARAGHEVLLLEASTQVGGLAAGLEAAGRVFDGGPYILLDKPGLAWAFEQLGARLEDHLTLLPLDEVYRVDRPGVDRIAIHGDLDRTVAGLEASFPGVGDRYRAHVARMAATYERMLPLQREGRPGPLALLRHGLVREVPFLLRGLAAHLEASGLPEPIQSALGIWTQVAGQDIATAPAPLALVPAIVHTRGAWTIEGGMRRVPEVLAELVREAGVEVRLGARVQRIERTGRRVRAVVVDGERIAADRVFSNAPGVGTYAELLQPPDRAMTRKVEALPLQSPGVGAWATATVDRSVPFLSFWQPAAAPIRLRIHPGAADPTRAGQIRLISPMDFDRAGRLDDAGQQAHLDGVLAERWWREGLSDVEVVARRVPREWGRRCHLYRDSMNPVMTAAFMRQGRMAHASPVADNLFLAGSATHPGQWVSFCAISGILAAREADR